MSDTFDVQNLGGFEPNIEAQSGYEPEDTVEEDLGNVADSATELVPPDPEAQTDVGAGQGGPGMAATPGQSPDSAAAPEENPWADYHPAVQANPALAPDADYKPNRNVEDATGGLLDYVEERMAGFGWGPQELPALVALWNETSSPYTQSHTGTAHWDPTARNPINGASGIPGLLIDTVETLGNPILWDNPEHQLDVGMTYINGKYQTPTNALNHMRRNNWY